MTALRLVAADTSLDSTSRARKRDSVLRVYRLTPAVLESAASRLASRPEKAVELLRAIDQSVTKAVNKSGTPSAPKAPPVVPRTPPAVKPATSRGSSL